MSTQPIAILSTGLVTSVGHTAAATCAAVRAKLTNPTETRFVDSSGNWMMAHSVALDNAFGGRTKLVKMAALAITECLENVPLRDWRLVPLLLCVAERERPGRLGDIDDKLFNEIQHEIGVEFDEQSIVVPHGRVGVGSALMHARRLLEETHVPFALIAATDSLLTWPTLSVYERTERLLTPNNSNGFMPGEGAAAILLGRAGKAPQLVCTGIGRTTEPARINSEQPLRGDGLTQAIKTALANAGCEMQDLDFRVSDLSGEQYYFKEAALALSRTLRVRKEEFDLWHPAECIGEAGAMSGLAPIIIANAACCKGYAPGPNVLFHAAADTGQRTAIILQFRAH
jgi:3-oxoacyl-[acyl-carrier-protein] synthase-1